LVRSIGRCGREAVISISFLFCVFGLVGISLVHASEPSWAGMWDTNRVVAGLESRCKKKYADSGLSHEAIVTGSGNERPDGLKGIMEMKKTMLLGFAASMAMIGLAKAQPVPLSAYADANGFIDVQALTCGQLANTYQEDANALSSWYSGWYNGLAHKHYADFKKGREVEHQVIEYCKAHPDERIIHAIGVMLREDRAEGMMMEK
jgi:hypothetical protein